MKFNTKYVPPSSPSVGFKLPSMTRQEFAKDADINNIISRYRETGFLTDPTRPSSRTPMFGDFSNVQDYQSALEALNQADEDFMKLPARVRDRFSNNPQELIDFLQDPANLEEAISLGLAVKPADKPADAPADAPADKTAG